MAHPSFTEQLELWPPIRSADAPSTPLADLGYLAGIIDGEGCISVKPSNGGSGLTIAVNVQMTDLDVLQRCQTICRLGTITGPRQRGTYKPIWRWGVARQQDVAALLMTTYPLVGSRRQARIREALAAWQALPPRKKPEPWGIPGENGCGTYAGSSAHHRHGTPLCDACRRAANEYKRSRRKRIRRRG